MGPGDNGGYQEQDPTREVKGARNRCNNMPQTRWRGDNQASPDEREEDPQSPGKQGKNLLDRLPKVQDRGGSFKLRSSRENSEPGSGRGSGDYQEGWW